MFQVPALVRPDEGVLVGRSDGSGKICTFSASLAQNNMSCKRQTKHCEIAYELPWPRSGPSDE